MNTMTIDDAAAFCRCSQRSLRLWMKRPPAPAPDAPFPGPVEHGHPKRWSRAEVVAWCEGNRAWVLQPRGE